MEKFFQSSSIFLNIEDKNQQKKLIVIVGGFFTLLLFVLILATPPMSFPENQIFSIEKGASLRSVSKEMKDKKMIRSRPFFETLVILHGGEKVISGDYFFGGKHSVFSLSRRVSKGEFGVSPIRATVLEGYSNEEIAKLFSAKLKDFNEEKFLEEAEDLQGYLFPDTYFFLSSDTETEVIKILNTNFEKKIESILPEIEESGKSLEDIITMASIIEKEANGPEDRGLISGILWKRIGIKMALQVDAAPVTYKERGLPEKPIANPGIKSIEAAIYPEASKYLYYLHDKTGKIYYARTYAEHLSNINKYLR